MANFILAELVNVILLSDICQIFFFKIIENNKFTQMKMNELTGSRPIGYGFPEYIFAYVVVRL